MIIKSLTINEKQYIKQALRTLLEIATKGSTAHWASGVMLENNGEFVDRLMIADASETRRTTNRRAPWEGGEQSTYPPLKGSG
jgi:hypothetical protein